MRLKFHGVLRKLYGEYVDIEARSIADAIEGFSRQQPNWPKDVPISVVGYPNPRDLFSDCPDEVDLAPAMRGGGGKFFNIIIGAAMIVAGILILPGNPALGTSLIVSGSMMVLQGVVQLFMKTPKFNRNEDPEASKYLNPNRNTIAPGTPITKAYGTIDLAGHWVSLQSNSNRLSYGVFPTNPT